MFMICAFLVVVCLNQSNSLFTSAPIGEVIPSNSKVTEGSNLTINCTLIAYTVTPLSSSALYFIAVYKNNPQVVDPAFYHILTDKTLQLVIPNVKREDGTSFKCYMNDSDLTSASDTWIGTASVDIGRPPNAIANVSVVSDNFANMTVSWCPTVLQKDPVDSHLSWAIENSNDLYLGNCSVWKSPLHCACLFCGTEVSFPCFGEEQTFLQYQTYNFTITSFNVYGSTTTSLQVYTNTAIVKPGPVKNLVVTPLSNRSIQSSWEYPQALFPQTVLLIFQINIFSEWGVNSTIDAGSNLSWLLTDLTPGTAYAVAVRCKPTEGGYWSDDSLKSAETMEDVPAVAPESPVGFFRISACQKEDNCPVTIFWKLINATLQNGVILGYRLTVESTLCTYSCELRVDGGNSTSADLSQLADGVSSWVRLVAYTSVGESPPHYIFFPPHYKSLPSIDDQGLYAEYLEDGTGIFFSWNYVEDVDNYTLMYCAGKQTDKTRCLSSPVSTTLPQHQTSFTMSPFNVDHVYALSSNFWNGTNGLTPNWICIYDYNGLPAMPEVKSITQVTDTSVKVVWSLLTCTTDNRVRVLNYTLSYINNAMLHLVNVTLPGNVTEYTITELTPAVNYSLTLRGISRSGPGQAAITSIKTDPAKPVNVVIPVVVSVVSSVVIIIIIAIIIYACRRSHKWFNSVTITTPDKYENKATLNETVCINSNYDALSDSGSNLPAYTDLTTVTSASVILEYESQVPPCQNSLQEVTEHSESVDSVSSNKTSSTSCESDQSIQTYTAVANPEMSSESPSSHCLMIKHYHDGDRLPIHDNVPLQLQPSFEELTQNSSNSYGYSQAHQCNNLDLSVDSCGSCDDYKSVRFKEGSFDEPVGDPIAPQLA